MKRPTLPPPSSPPPDVTPWTAATFTPGEPEKPKGKKPLLKPQVSLVSKPEGDDEPSTD